MSVLPATSTTSYAVDDRIQRRADRTARPAPNAARPNVERTATTATAGTRANARARAGAPEGMDTELWGTLSSEELDHFIRPAMSALVFGAGYSGSAKHSGVPRGMHLDIRA